MGISKELRMRFNAQGLIMVGTILCFISIQSQTNFGTANFYGPPYVRENIYRL